jgi:excisionase family DNA binding protein
MNQPFVERRKSATAPTFMTEGEVAKRLNVSVASLRRWRLLKKGPAFVKIGALVRYRPEDLDSWLASLPKGGSCASATRLQL